MSVNIFYSYSKLLKRPTSLFIFTSSLLFFKFANLILLEREYNIYIYAIHNIVCILEQYTEWRHLTRTSSRF